MVDALVEQWLAPSRPTCKRRLQTNPTSIIGPLTELTAKPSVPGETCGHC
jgi:hypothetical protein